MASKFVRCIKNVEDITKLSDNVTEENDIVSDVHGNIYIRKDVGFHKLYDGDGINVDEQLEDIIKDIESLEKDLNKIDLTIYAKKSDLVEYVKEGDLTLYAKKTDLDTYAKKSDLTLYAKFSDLDTYAKKSDLAVYVKVTDLNEYAKKSELPDLTEYAKKADIPSPPDLTEYAKKTDIPSAPDLTPYAKKTDLTPYAKKTDVNNLITDTGWQNLELLNEVQAYSEEGTPQYRVTRYNGVTEVSIRGEVKNIKKTRTIIARIPIDDVLTQAHAFVQPTSLKRDVDGDIFATFVRWGITPDKDIELQNVSYKESKLTDKDWFPVNTTFKI